jgi:hypothetical protein
MALAEFTDFGGVPTTLGGVPLEPDEPIDVRYSAGVDAPIGCQADAEEGGTRVATGAARAPWEPTPVTM